MPEPGYAADRPSLAAGAPHGPGFRHLRSAGLRLGLLLGIVVLLLAGTFAAVAARDHAAAIEDGWTKAERAAASAADQAGRALSAAHLVAGLVAEAVQIDGLDAMQAAGTPPLAQQLRQAPQLGTIAVMDGAARVVAIGAEPAPEPAEPSGWPGVARRLGTAETALVPLRPGRTAREGGVGVIRAVRDGAGGMIGIVVATLPGDAFRPIGHDVALHRTADGAPLMLLPAAAAAGLAGMRRRPPGIPPPAVLQAAARNAGAGGRFEAEAAAGGTLLVAWRRDGEVIALVAVPREDALAAFHAGLGRQALFFGVAAAVLAGLGASVAAGLAQVAAARRAAEARQQELAAMLEATSEGVIALDAEWRIRFLNTRAAHALAPGGDVTGLPFWDAVPELVGGPVWQACEQAMRGTDRITAEVEIPSTGRCLRAESHARKAGGALLFLRDVTEERAAAARLAESEARLRRVLDNLFVFVGVLDPDGTLLEANRAPLEAAGLAVGEVRGRPFWECHWWSHDPGAQARLRAACARAAAGEASRYDVEVRMAGDSRMVIDFQIAPLRDAAGRVTHLIPSATDVTARRAAEAALAASEARLRLAQEAAEVGVFEFDLAARREHWSAAMFRIYGLDPAGRGPLVPEDEFFGLLHPDDRAAQRARRDALSSDASQARFRFEFRIRRPDTQEMRWIASRGEVVRNAEGRPLLLRGVSYDVTERRRAEERLLLLAREVDHRAKNALAVVQAIIGLTRHDDPEQFRAAVAGRIAAMARAHTLLAREGWGRAELRELVEEELGSFRAGSPPRAVLCGPPVALAAGAAQPLAMALHELATNAVRHGALSVPEGQVVLAWEETAEGGLTLRWSERGGPPPRDTAPPRGFGASVIRNTVERQLAGRVAFDWAPAGLVCTIALPPAQIVWRERSLSPAA